MMSVPILRLFGAPAFQDGASAQRFAPERVFQVIGYLACKADWVHRGVLAALFYGDHPEEAARRNLRKLLLRAREFDWFAQACEATRDSVRLQMRTDVQALVAAAREKRTQAVLDLYRGPLLEGLDAPECRGYSEWLEAERERLRMHWRDAAFAALGSATTSREAIDISARLVAADAFDEAALRAHLTALCADGQSAQAQRLYRGYALRLANELGVEPSVELRTMFEGLPTGDFAPAARPAPSVRAGSDDGFIGRVAELQQIAALLAQEDCRLLTLVGPGGVGKSSLAKQALQAVAKVWPGSARFIALEDVGAPAEIGARLARDLDINLAGNSEPLDQVAGSLRETRWLLALDNFEHLASDASAITRLLEACPQLKLIVTSRTRLAIAHEWLLPVEGLPYPAPEDDDRADAFDAVRLFFRAARRVKPTFTLAGERAAIVEICRQVDGLPLALEIAAAWTRVLSCSAIVAELAHGTELLRTADRARPTRQASIEAVFEHSWRLLAPVERETLARLSVFRSSVTRDTARAVTGASLPVLAALADKSLLQVPAADRCSLHPLVRTFAHERLQQDAQAARAVAQRHAEFYCAQLGEHAAMESVNQREVLESVAPELGDAVAALAWARAEERWDLVGPSALVLSQIFDLSGRPREGLAALGPLPQLHALATRAQARSYGQLAIGHATLFHRLAQFTSATACAEQALRAYRAAGDGEGVRMALSILSTTLLKLGRHAESRRYCLHGLKSAERAADQVGIATFLNNLGQVDNELGHWDAAIEHYERALAVNRTVVNQVGVIAQMNNLALAHIGAGRHEQARVLLLEGLRLVDEAGFGALRTYFLANLARASLELGRIEEAREFAENGLALSRSVADLTNVPGLLIVLGELALRNARIDKAQAFVREAAEVTRSTQHRRWLVRSLMAHARVLQASGNSAAAGRIVLAIEASPASTPTEVADARALARQLAVEPAAPGQPGRSAYPTLDQLVAEVANGRAQA